MAVPKIYQIQAQLITFTRDNWSLTPLKLPGFNFDDTGIDKWIEIQFMLNDGGNSIIGYGDGVGRINVQGTFIVYCRAELRDNCLVIADEVSNIFTGQTLSNDLRIGIPQFSDIRDLESDLFELKVSFEINQS